MATTPEQLAEIQGRRGVVLGNSPFLRAYIDQTPQSLDDWLDGLHDNVREMDQKLERTMGKNWHPLLMVPLRAVEARSIIFAPEAPSPERERIIATAISGLLIVGYESGRRELVELFGRDILQSFEKRYRQYIAPNLFFPPYQQHLVNWMAVNLDSGMNLRLLHENDPVAYFNAKTPPPEPKIEVPDAFKAANWAF